MGNVTLRHKRRSNVERAKLSPRPFHFTTSQAMGRPAPRDQECILGFLTEDLDALVARIAANGGTLVGPIKSMPEHGIRVVFATDPEGHLSENVQMVPT